MNSEDMEIRNRLLSVIRERKAILFAGAGCSKISGYPLWTELIENMHNIYVPALTLSPNIDYGVRADQIKDQMARMGLEREYFTHLERTFEPGQGKNHTTFHCTLVKLGFSGIVTTNYDILLECSVDEAFASKDTFPRCDQIDLCIQKQYTYRVFKFLRNLSTTNKHSEILHIHGIYNNPYGIILTRNDYLKAYGELSNDGMDVEHQQPLDTIHRKVIYGWLSAGRSSYARKKSCSNLFIFASHFFKGCAPVIYPLRSIHPQANRTPGDQATPAPFQENPWEKSWAFLGAMKIKVGTGNGILLVLRTVSRDIKLFFHLPPLYHRREFCQFCW